MPFQNAILICWMRKKNCFNNFEQNQYRFFQSGRISDPAGLKIIYNLQNQGAKQNTK